MSKEYGASESESEEEAPSSPPRPGPDALYGDNPTPPQLENGPGWEAEPLMVSGCDAYVDGEYLYQDYVYDDRGADTRSWVSGSPTNASSLGGVLSQPTGDYHYPNDVERYGYNAADLLEFRAQPTEEGVRYRITLNTMLEPDAAAVAVGIDTEAAQDFEGGPERRTDWGYGLGELGAPVDHRLVTWGTGAELDDEPLDDDRLTVDVRRRQIDVEVPLDPGEETWRHYVVVGLWDPATREFKQVAVSPDDERPGGAKKGRDTPPVFNVGFRFDEPYNRNLGPVDVGRGLFDLLDVTGIGHSILEQILDRSPRVLGEGNWREHAQAMALADRDISRFGADVDFGKLRDRVTERNTPESGIVSLLYPSRYYLGEGIDTDHDILEGRIQPYSAYIPEDLEEPAPMVMLLHSLSCSYTQYAVYTPNLIKDISEPNNAVVLMPQARGPGRWYKREAELDIFEAWRDLETRVDIDRSRVTLGGYSMGGFGTCVLAAQCPDLFGRGFSVVGPPTEDPIEGVTGGLIRAPPSLTTDLFGGEGGGQVLNVFTEGPSSALEITENLRHVPMLVWNGLGDPLVPVISPDNYARRLRKHGYRHQFDVFPAETHLSFGVRDRWTGIPEFVSRSKVIRNPRRVTYRHLPRLDHPEVDLVHDGAYWVSDIRTREDRNSGLVDAISYADGYAPPEVGTFTEYGRQPRRHLSRGVQWETPPIDARTAPENRLEVRLEGVDSVTLWVEEAGLDVDDELTIDIDSDAPATITLATAFDTHDIEVPAGESTKKVLLGERGPESGALA
ncbi:prolyl oligopeptidase family serine peptidase [Natronomonas marina]|uniref:prolyl oligopeptidase family serine peptidase n=1 Tax=Natronomonas marina TaxID=2961939 RepID=UPI0020C9BA99|nr:prolyl oligopeptidase family serine peptidase [Natronomonas marina]